MDDLKKYLQNRREELDLELPREEAWQAIRDKLCEAGPRPVRNLLPYVRWAVAAMLVVAVGIVFYNSRPALVFLQATRMSALGSSGSMISGYVSIGNHMKVHEPASTMDTVVVIGYSKRRVQKRKLQQADPLQNVEASYTSMIDQQLRALRTQPIYVENEDYFATFKNQFISLGKDEEMVREMIRVQGLSGQALDALMNIYQRKIGVLKALQFEITSMNNMIRQRNPEKDFKPAFINL